MKFVLPLILAALPFLCHPALAQSDEARASAWVEKNAVNVLSINPARFEDHMKEIAPFFTGPGFTSYRDVTVSSGWDKKTLAYTSACVAEAKTKDGMVMVKTYMALPEVAPPPVADEDENIYYIEESDLLYLGEDQPNRPDVFKLKVLKTDKPIDFYNVTLVMAPDKASGALKINNVLYDGKTRYPSENCIQYKSADQQVAALSKVRNRFAADIKLLDKKINQLKGQPAQ